MNQMLQMMAKQMLGNNPLYQRAQQMAQGKSEKELEQIAQNLCRTMGINMDDAIKQFEMQMKNIQSMMPHK